MGHVHTYPHASGPFVHALHSSVPIRAHAHAQKGLQALARVGGMHIHTCMPWPAISLAHWPRVHNPVPGRGPKIKDPCSSIAKHRSNIHSITILAQHKKKVLHCSKHMSCFFIILRTRSKIPSLFQRNQLSSYYYERFNTASLL